ncbi:MAG: efflux RND transporter periplasmic adaptor subunit [Bacteroidales bacterium]|nr:efflux RND transporter periplasmic adaptor subunit [Bacteroidales bacterium]
MKTNPAMILMFACMVVISCNNPSAEIPVDKTNLLEISKSQFQSEKMEFGEPSFRPLSESVHFTGTLCPSPNGIAQISLPVAGIINKIYCNPGQLVNIGQNLIEVSGNEFIDMQRDFAESAASLNRLKSDYERIRELFDENIGTQKELILAESNYKSEKAKNTALGIKLGKIGLDMSKIEDGTFYNSYLLKTPVKGYVTMINVTVGQYVEPQLMVAEIIDVERFQLKISVFEKDLKKLETGQKIEYYLSGNNKELQKAKLTIVGKSINHETKAIECYAEIEKSKAFPPINNQFAEGEIIVDADSIFSLPETAFIRTENEAYILTLEKETDESYFFNKIKIKTGRKNKNAVELIEKPKINKLLINGVDNLKIE